MRLTKLYTRQGDAGYTRLASGEKIAKSALLMQAIGEADDCNSRLGWAMCQLPEELLEAATQVQHWLFDVGGELALPEYKSISSEAAAQVESWIDALNAELSPLEEFILPGGSEAAARMQLFRSGLRGFERCLVELETSETTKVAVNPASLALINRLSDWAFAAARRCNQLADVAEPYWQNKKNSP